MATDAVIQYIAAGESVNTSHRRVEETFVAAEAISVGDWIAFDPSAAADGDVTLTVFKADGNSTPVLTPMGVALEAATAAGQQIRCCISGVCDAATLDAGAAGMAIGAILQISNTAGSADIASAASAQPVCGILAETVAAAAGAGVRRVIVRRSF